MTTLYRLYDQAGALVEIGVTSQTFYHLVFLAHVHPPWKDVTAIQLERFSSEQDAWEHAQHLIVREHPKHLGVGLGELSFRTEIH